MPFQCWQTPLLHNTNMLKQQQASLQNGPIQRACVWLVSKMPGTTLFVPQCCP